MREALLQSTTPKTAVVNAPDSVTETQRKALHMRSRILMGLLVALISIGGFVAGRSRTNSKVRRTTIAAATITSQQTEFFADGITEAGTRIVTRRQYSDGRWKTHMENAYGEPFNSSGRIDPASKPTAEEWAAYSIANGRRQDEVLGYKVWVQHDPSGTEVWYCAELDTVLKVILYQDGKLSSITEPISVVVGESQD